MMNTGIDVSANTGSFGSESQALQAIVQRIVDAVDPVSVWLFGSRAKGNHRPDSDFDLLVVTKLQDGELGYDYDRVYAPILGTGVGCDVIPCRIDDFERESNSATGLVRDVVREGVQVYGEHQSQ